MSLSPETVRAIVEPVEPGYVVTDMVTRTGGEVSTVYEIRGAGAARPLIVKIYAPEWRPKLLKEVYVYRLLARHGIRHIPRILHAAPHGVPALPLAYIVMTRLDGQPLSEVVDDLSGADLAGIYQRMGQLLAAVHRITKDQWGYVTTRVVDAKPGNTAYMTDQFARRLRVFGQLGGDPALARAIDRHVARCADLFATCPGQCCATTTSTTATCWCTGPAPRYPTTRSASRANGGSPVSSTSRARSLRTRCSTSPRPTTTPSGTTRPSGRRSSADMARCHAIGPTGSPSTTSITPWNCGTGRPRRASRRTGRAPEPTWRRSSARPELSRYERPTASRLRSASMTLAMWSRMAFSAALGERDRIASTMRSCCGSDAAGRPGSSESVY